MNAVLSLIGEQPVPVLLVDRYLKPKVHVLLYTEFTHRVAERLRKVMPQAVVPEKPTPAYDLARLQHILETWLRRYPQMTLHLTSGTKPMSWAGYEIARRYHRPLVYVQSQGPRETLHLLHWREGRPVPHPPQRLPALITLNDYLQIHGLGLPPQEGGTSNAQEEALLRFFRRYTHECRSNLKYPAFEIDFLIRRYNRVAVVEAKDRRGRRQKRRDGLDTLTTIAARERLGIYTGKLWIVSRPLGWQLRELARAYHVEVVVVKHMHNRLTAESEAALREALDRLLGPL